MDVPNVCTCVERTSISGTGGKDWIMSALAERWESSDSDVSAVGRTEAAERPRPRREAPARRSGSRRQDGSWNVLAEQLVAFPNRATELFVDRGAYRRAPSDGTAEQYAQAWLDDELSRLRARRLEVRTSFDRLDAPRPLRDPFEDPAPTERLGSPATIERPAIRHQREATIGAERPDGLRRDAASANQSRSGHAHDLSRAATRPRTRTAATEQRGLRRFLPGAATLVVLAATWLGVGALSSADHQVQVRVLPGSVLVGGHADYVVRPGDTLWSIATRVEPGADPRPLVDELQAELHGKVLQPGDTLVLPR